MFSTSLTIIKPEANSNSSRGNMKNQQLPMHQYSRQSKTSLLSRLNTKAKLSVVIITLSYAFLLSISYSLGYLVGTSFSIKDITTFVISKTSLPSEQIIITSTEPLYYMHATHCSEAMPPEFVRQTIISRVYNGTSPYEDIIPPRSTSSLLPKDIKEWEVIYKSLIQSVRPKTIIKFSTSLGESATYMANLTSQLGLETQIICLHEFPSRPVFRDLFEDIAMPYGEITLLNRFIGNVISQNATETILPLNLSTISATEKLCEWGIYGDLIEVDAGRDFHSVWSDINNAHKLLRPGGVLFGHSYFSSYYGKGIRQAVRLFARVNRYHVKADGQHWIINTASITRD